LYLFWLFLILCRWRWGKHWTRLLQHNQVSNIRNLLILLYSPRRWLLHYSGNYDSLWSSFHIAIINQLHLMLVRSYSHVGHGFMSVLFTSTYSILKYGLLSCITIFRLPPSMFRETHQYCSSSISIGGRAVRWDFWILEKDKMF